MGKGEERLPKFHHCNKDSMDVDDKDDLTLKDLVHETKNDKHDTLNIQVLIQGESYIGLTQTLTCEGFEARSGVL